MDPITLTQAVAWVEQALQGKTWSARYWGLGQCCPIPVPLNGEDDAIMASPEFLRQFVLLVKSKTTACERSQYRKWARQEASKSRDSKTAFFCDQEVADYFSKVWSMML